MRLGCFFLLHAHHVLSDHPRVIVQLPDTDVSVICVHRSMTCHKNLFRTLFRTSDEQISSFSNKRRIILMLVYWYKSMHGLTITDKISMSSSCDSTSALLSGNCFNCWKQWITWGTSPGWEIPFHPLRTLSMHVRSMCVLSL